MGKQWPEVQYPWHPMIQEMIPFMCGPGEKYMNVYLKKKSFKKYRRIETT